MSKTPRKYVKLSDLALLGEAFNLPDVPERRPGPKQSRGKLQRQHARKRKATPVVLATGCGLCGAPLAAGRFLCPDHMQRALDASDRYRAKARLPGPGRIFITDPDLKDTFNV